MAITVYFAKVAKRKNSTLQATFNTSFDVVLKSDCSIDRPTFLLSSSSFDFNVAKWGDKYYFIDEIKSVRNGQWEVGCVIDVLATYKADILASTQFVSYSSQSGGTWLADTRIPLEQKPTVSANTAATSFFANTGYYILSIVSISGCEMFAVTETTLRNILNSITQWKLDNENASMQGLTFTDPDLENITTALVRSGAIGNTWDNTTKCIRECHWTPFIVSGGTGGVNIWLGDFNTGQSGIRLDSIEPITSSQNITIPWQFNDWRRVICEDIYLYVPLVGMISIPSENIAHTTTLTIEWSYTLSDGVITFKVMAGNEVVGTYGANCSAQVPIGILQAVGAGQLLNTVTQGMEKMAAASIGGTAIATAGMAYEVASLSISKNLTCIGGIGGGAGAGLDKNIRCISVSHDPVITPSNMKDTMGLPTMQPMSLATLTGYCQCANAHVAANGAQGFELDAIDSFLNTGFYIE